MGRLPLKLETYLALHALRAGVATIAGKTVLDALVAGLLAGGCPAGRYAFASTWSEGETWDSEGGSMMTRTGRRRLLGVPSSCISFLMFGVTFIDMAEEALSAVYEMRKKASLPTEKIASCELVAALRTFVRSVPGVCGGRLASARTVCRVRV